MFDSLADLIRRLDRENLRVEKPDHVVFMCGGVISPAVAQATSPSLRDYLVRQRKLQNRIDGRIVLAEAAQQLYRDTSYPDLISFEEDIARVASLVLVITESPGSLAELGAFASEEVIRDALRVIISEEHFERESFVRYGPVKRIENIDRARVATFPWRTHKNNGHIIKSTARAHFADIAQFVNQRLREIDKSHLYRTLGDNSIFYDILWILSLLEAVPPEPLYQCVRLIHPDVDDDRIRNCLFTLRICEWVDLFSYSNRDFYYLPVNRDPFEYRYLLDQRPRSIDALKIEIVTAYRDGIDLSRNILKRLQEKREARK